MGYWSNELNDNGNRFITFSHRNGYQDLPVFLPCGKCIGCRLEYSRWWALRCVNESQLYEENSFITLTYNNEHLPSDHGLHKDELQKFMKRLRKKYNGKTIRYFGCGEYGDNTSRPHYHLCLFNYSPKDKIQLRSREIRRYQGQEKVKGDDLYKSQEISDLWQGRGFNTVGSLKFESAAYVARYVTKKIKGPQAEKVYGERQPPFAVMSRRPGIGRGWIEKYKNDIYAKDYFKYNGRNLRPCRYYDEFLKKEDPERYKQIKEKRFKDQEKYPDHQENMRKQYVKNLKNKKLLKRSLHDEDK